ncbi:MAG: four helix bundle protein [Gemmatimonadetes bacterium]|nr:four helix bundle protein [Gemmatimonadota bacterium]
MEYTPNALEERLIDFGAAICKAVRGLPRDYVGTHLHRQLVRSATSPAANYAEARGAESTRDFVHKMQVCLKELRETSVWLRFVHRLCGSTVDTDRLTRECSELIAVFVSGINTAKAKSRRRQQRQPAG